MKKGFTLIELLIIIAVVAIITAALFPILAKAREKARETTCISNQKQIATAVMMYTQEHDEKMPGDNMWKDIRFVSEWVFKCPKNDVLGTVSYGYNEQVKGLGLGEILAPTDTILTADASKEIITSLDDIAFRHSGKAVTSFVDSHIVIISPEDIEKAFNNFKKLE